MKTTPACRKARRAGVTLAETMIALSISVLVLTGIVISFLAQSSEYRRHRDAVELRQNAGAAVTRVLRDVRLAGYGLPISSNALTQWITWVSGISNNVRVIAGASGAPDRLLLAGAFDPPAGYVQVAADRGATSLILKPGGAANFNTTNRKLVYIDRQELARVTGVAGTTITLSTHPTVAGRGLRYPHAPDAPVELVQVVEYACNASSTNSLRRPFLYRNDNRGVLTNQLQQLVAMGIEDFQVALDTGRVAISISAVAQRIDRIYTHPTKGDKFRRLNVDASAAPRNPLN